MPLFHPADPEWTPTVRDGAPFGCYGEDLDGIAVRTRAEVEAQCGKDLLSLLAASDVIVSPTSSEVTRAILLGRPVIRPFFPGDRAFLEKGGYPPPHYFSDVALGCSVGPTTESAFLAAFEVMLNTESATCVVIANAQRDHFDPSGRYAVKVVAAIEEVLNGA